MCVTNTTPGRRPQPVTFNNVALMNAFAPPKAAAAVVAPLFFPPEQQQPQVFSVVLPPKKAQRPKRRRKPQKPGKTAKNQERHFVVHNYHDHANDADVDDALLENGERRRGGVGTPFPAKLQAVLDQVEHDGLAHIVSWAPHGRCFIIHDPHEFVNHVMPKYFRQTKLTSFQRQLNLYGFARLTRGDDAGGYYHELFLRGKEFLSKRMARTKVKGTRFKAASSPDQEPDFYTMPPVLVSQHPSDEEMSTGEATLETMTTAPMSEDDEQKPSSLEPLPIQYASLSSPQAAPSQEPVLSADQVLDEAVAELFLDQSSSSTDDVLDDFCADWDPSFSALEDDTQLGYMLEKLLED